ncbi:hypothetical protein ACFZAR_41560 [Streptomyces sp. NPDC008222]|uniref:hypothetical protein n=1 Tax=Streptomyces sp. NPDC008222 TaxID=3364820 RepID=UPI0036EE7302
MAADPRAKGSTELADDPDLVQEAYARVRFVRPVSTRRELRAWMKKITVNQHMSARRRQQCRPNLCFPSGVEDLQLELGAYVSEVSKSAKVDALERIVNPDLKVAFRQIPHRVASLCTSQTSRASRIAKSHKRWERLWAP